MRARRRDPVSPAELRARALALAVVVEDEDAGHEDWPLLILRLGADWYGIPAASVREVVAGPRVTPLPLSPPAVSGVINLRGEIIGVLDLVALLGRPAPANGRGFAVVVRHGEFVAAFLADEVDDLQWFSASGREPVLSTLPAEGARFFAGAFHGGDRLIAELNVGELLNHPQLTALRDRSEQGAG